MDENFELVEYVYQDADMATVTITEMLRDLNDKDNKIKKPAENILKGYERYTKEAKEILEAHDVELKPNSLMAKMGANMGVKKEVKCDNSDSSMAEMLIQGISMGSLDMEKKLKEYKEGTKKEIYKFAEDFYQFQQENIKALKKFL